MLFQLELKPAQRVLRFSWGLFAFSAGIKTSAEGFEVLLGTSAEGLPFQLELKPAQRVLRFSWGLFAFSAGIKTSAEGFEVLLGAICFFSWN